MWLFAHSESGFCIYCLERSLVHFWWGFTLARLTYFAISIMTSPTVVPDTNFVSNNRLVTGLMTWSDQNRRLNAWRTFRLLKTCKVRLQFGTRTEQLDWDINIDIILMKMHTLMLDPHLYPAFVEFERHRKGSSWYSTNSHKNKCIRVDFFGYV